MSKDTIRLAVDAVVFGYKKESGISVLLIQRKYPPFENCWALPGGFVLENESLEEAVERELVEESGVSINYLEQLYTFGAPKRDPRSRIVSVAYYGLVRPDGFELNATTDAKDAKWFTMENLPELAFDHQEILSKAIERLRSKIHYEPIGFELLDTKFPFSDLERLYSILLGRDIDRRNFKKKFMSLDVLDELDEKDTSPTPGRKGNLFQFNEQKYFALKAKGIFFEI